MNDGFSYFMAMLPQLLKFTLYLVASICMAISYVKLKQASQQTGSKPLLLLAKGFGFHFLSFLVGIVISIIGLAFAQYLAGLAYYGIQYSAYLFTIIGTVYFALGAKQFLAKV